MLQESEQLFDSLKKEAQQAVIKKAKRQIFLKTIRKKIIKYGLILSISCVILFPKQSGYVIGKWMNNFFGTIITESVKNIDNKIWMQRK